MKHAILLTVHDNVPVVKTLMQMLDDDRFTFYLLLDKKSKHSPSEYIPKLNYAKVCTVPRITMNWGAYSLIKGELILMEAALKDKAEYLHYLNGADLPLKDADAIDAFLEKAVFLWTLIQNQVNLLVTRFCVSIFLRSVGIFVQVDF